MPNTSQPFGFAPLTVQGRAPQATDYHRYLIRASDTKPYRRGDAVSGVNDADSTGVQVVTMATGSAAVRGVIGAVEPASPNVPFGGDGVLMSVPAVKARDYYVWVLDDPTAEFTVQDDGVSPASASALGKLCSFAPGYATAGATSGATLLTSSIGTGVTVELLGLAAGSSLGAYATWRVAFEQHERAAGGGGQASVSGAWKNRNVICFYGDSHQQKGHASSSGAAIKYEYFYADAFPWWVQVLSRRRFRIGGWRAIGGKTTTEILGWIDRVLELKPGVVILNGGTNDGVVANLIDPNIPMANIETIWQTLTAYGITVITLTPVITDPTAFSVVTYPAAQKNLMLKSLRHMMIERAPLYPGVILVDAYGAGVNPLSATGAPRTNYLRPDKTHTTNIYAYKIAKAIVAAIDEVIPPMPTLVASVADNTAVSGESGSKNLLLNHLFTATTGGTLGTGASGTVPSGWTVRRAIGAAGTAVASSTAARADGVGNDLVLTITGDAAETNGLIVADYSIPLTNIIELESYYAKFEVTLAASPVATKSVYCQLSSDSISPTSSYFADAGHTDDIAGGSMYALEEGFTGVMETPACIAQPGVTAGNFKVRIGVYVGASASCVVRIGLGSLHRVDGYPSPMNVISGAT